MPRLHVHASPRKATATGLTLVELLVALAIAGMLLVWGARWAGDWLVRGRQLNEARGLAEVLHLARSEAIKRGHRVGLCPSADGATCAGDGRWERGYMVFSDDDGDASRGAGEAVVRRAGPNEHAITVRGNRPVADYVSFTAQGLSRLRSGALGMGTFTVCTRGQQAIEVVLANGGRPRIQDGRSVCP